MTYGRIFSLTTWLEFKKQKQENGKTQEEV